MCSTSVSMVSLLCLPLRLSTGAEAPLPGSSNLDEEELPVEVTVKPGEDATLPCHGPRDAEITLVKWSKPEMKSERYVFVYRQNQPIEKFQDPSYRGRVELKHPDMKDGDVSVVLKNVTFNDAGRYQCLVVNGKGQNRTEQTRNITLEVQGYIIRAEPGQSVTLPCRAPSNTDIIVVQWTRPGLKPEYVLLYRDGKLDPHNQHPFYQSRVELEDKEMKDGDVSIILKNVTSNDTGTYECRVLLGKTNDQKRSGNTELFSIVHLQVQSGDTGGRGDEEGGDSSGRVGLGSGLAAMFVAAAAAAAFIIYRKRKPTEQNPPSVAMEMLASH